MAVDSGIEKLEQIQRAQADRLRARALNDLWCKLHTLVRTMPGKQVSQHQEFCRRLESTPAADREAAVLAEYGRACVDKLMPLLRQLESAGA